MPLKQWEQFLIMAVIALPMAKGLSAQGDSAAPPRLVPVKLPYGIEVGIPVGWVLEDAASNERRTKRGMGVIDLADLPSGPGGVILTASPDGNPDRVSVVISVIRRPSAGQADVAALESGRLEQVNEQYRLDLETGMRTEGATMIEWLGASRVRLGDLYSLVSRYTYRMTGGEARAMEGHRIFLGGGSVGFMLQSPVEESGSHQADFAAIRASFQAVALP